MLIRIMSNFRQKVIVEYQYTVMELNKYNNVLFFSEKTSSMEWPKKPT